MTPPGFLGVEIGRAFDVAVPIGTEPLIKDKDTALDSRSYSWLTIMLRLKPGQSLDAATAMLRSMQPQIREGSIPPNLFSRDQQAFLSDPFTLVPAATGTSELREQYRRPLLTTLVVVALVLLIACANIANLLLARATARRHELSVRLALGASRWRLARQWLVESLVLAGIGASVGAVFAAWASRALVAQLTSVSRVALDLSLDWRVMAFTAVITVATAVLFGTAPAFRATRAAAIEALKEPAVALRASAWLSRVFGGRVNLSNGLVVAQVALSLVLVVAAALFIRTFEHLARLPLGFDGNPVLVVDVDATRAASDPEKRIPLYPRLVAAVAAVPGVARAAAASITPLDHQGMSSTIMEPRLSALSERERTFFVNFVTPGWFATYGTAIREGRDIDEHDAKNAPPVVLVNQALARRLFPDRKAVGETILGKTVVGVVGDAVYMSLRDGMQPTMYLPLAQWDWGGNPPNPPPTEFSISVRSSTLGSPMRLARSVAAALTEANRDLDFSFRPLGDLVDASLTQERLVAMLSGFFGALALLLAAFGIYGVTSYAVNRRRAEIGIRMALGATPGAVVRLVLSRVFVLVALGVVVGGTVSVWASRFVAALLFGLEPRDPATLIGSIVVLAAVGALAGWLPARRAARFDPMVALRHE